MKIKFTNIIIATLLFVFLGFSMTAFAAESGKVKVSTETVQKSGVAEVKVSLENNPGIAAYKFTLNFDKTKLEPVFNSVKKGSAMGTGSITSNIQSEELKEDMDDVDSVTVLGVSASNFTSNGVLYSVKFKVKEGTTGVIPVSIAFESDDVSNQTFNDVALQKQDGSVTVGVLGGTIIVSPKTKTIKVGENVQLTATVSPATANQAVTYTSNKPNIAKVSESGKVTGVASGNATITVTSASGAKPATCTITVQSAVVKPGIVTLNTKKANLTVGKTLNLTATVKPSNATVKTVTWSTANKSIATVDKNGKVTAVKPGTVEIKATSSDKKVFAVCEIKVTATVVTKIKLNKTALELKVGKTFDLNETVTPSNATNKKVTWKTLDSKTATVSSSGLVTAKKIGKTTIKVTSADGKITATCTVKVVK